MGATRFAGVGYTWPGDNGDNGQALTTDGNGNLTWEDVLTSSSVLWTLTNEVIHPKNASFHDLAIGGTSTASATFLARATDGQGYFAGNLGIGTTNPQNPLYAHAETDDEIARFYSNDAVSRIAIEDPDDVAYLFTESNKIGLGFEDWLGAPFVNGIIIDSSGNIGIGTTNPTTKLTLSSTDNLTTLRLEETSGTDANWELRAHNNINPVNGFSIWGGTEGSEDARLVINTSGNVGIGTTNPGYELEVDGWTRTVGLNQEGSQYVGWTDTLSGYAFWDLSLIHI